MNFNLKVEITDPETPKGMSSSLIFNLYAHFTYDEEQYGNGFYVCIRGQDFYRQVIDLRYDQTFDSSNKTLWLSEWAFNYWTGKNGAWSIKNLEISSMD